MENWQSYDLKIDYTSAQCNVIANTLSRLPINEDNVYGHNGPGQ